MNYEVFTFLLGCVFGYLARWWIGPWKIELEAKFDPPKENE